MLRKIISWVLIFCFSLSQTSFAQLATELNLSGYLSRMGSAMAVDKFRPLHLRYFSYDEINNQFKILLDKGDVKELEGTQLQDSTRTLLNYFLVGVTLTNDSFWVNLRPDSEDQIIDPWLEKTDVGKIMLEADLQLKKDTALLTSPQTPEGKEYWERLYKKAEELFGYEAVEIPALTRPWIVPGEIIIRETQESAYVYKATLKVMLEQDYLSGDRGQGAGFSQYEFKDPRSKALNEYSTQLIRELIIPKLNKEVNSAKRYAPVRQVYYSLILSRWFKNKFSGKSGGYASLINARDLNGLTSKEAWSKTTYFKEYQKSFQQGEYNIKQTVSTPTGQVIRSYFSGGFNLAQIQASGVRGSSALPKPQNTVMVAGKGDSLSVQGEIAGSSPLKIEINEFENPEKAAMHLALELQGRHMHPGSLPDFYELYALPMLKVFLENFARSPTLAEAQECLVWIKAGEEDIKKDKKNRDDQLLTVRDEYIKNSIDQTENFINSKFRSLPTRVNQRFLALNDKTTTIFMYPFVAWVQAVINKTGARGFSNQDAIAVIKHMAKFLRLASEGKALFSLAEFAESFASTYAQQTDEVSGALNKARGYYQGKTPAPEIFDLMKRIDTFDKNRGAGFDKSGFKNVADILEESIRETSAGSPIEYRERIAREIGEFLGRIETKAGEKNLRLYQDILSEGRDLINDIKELDKKDTEIRRLLRPYLVKVKRAVLNLSPNASDANREVASILSDLDNKLTSIKDELVDNDLSAAPDLRILQENTKELAREILLSYLKWLNDLIDMVTDEAFAGHVQTNLPIEKINKLLGILQKLDAQLSKSTGKTSMSDDLRTEGNWLDLTKTLTPFIENIEGFRKEIDSFEIYEIAGNLISEFTKLIEAGEEFKKITQAKVDAGPSVQGQVEGAGSPISLITSVPEPGTIIKFVEHDKSRLAGYEIEFLGANKIIMRAPLESQFNREVSATCAFKEGKELIEKINSLINILLTLKAPNRSGAYFKEEYRKVVAQFSSSTAATQESAGSPMLLTKEEKLAICIKRMDAVLQGDESKQSPALKIVLFTQIMLGVIDSLKAIDIGIDLTELKKKTNQYRENGLGVLGEETDGKSEKLQDEYKTLLKIAIDFKEKLIAEREKEKAKAAGSPVKTGGIDFRSLPMTIKPMGSFEGLNMRLPQLSSSALMSFNISQEIQQLNQMVSSGIIPSGARVQELVSVCLQKGQLQEHQEEILTILAETCKLQEGECCESSDQFKVALLAASAA